MSGDTTKVSLWSDADVYVTSNLAAALPADASSAFSSDWTLVGLLDGDAGIERNFTETVTDHYAWGGILCATTHAKYKEEKVFTVLEDNVTTRSLIWPGSSPGQIIVPRPADIKIAFETRNGGKVHRLISQNRAQVSVSGSKVTENEKDMTAVPLVATIYPDSSGVLYVEQGKPTLVSIALTPLTLALSLAAAFIKPIVATATYSDSTTGNVSLPANWLTSAPTKATVVDGYVTGLTTGSASISAIYGGVTSTAPCVVTVAA